jgi:DNA invertase Pin-like site-specific DNA recombinase
MHRAPIVPSHGDGRWRRRCRWSSRTRSERIDTNSAAGELVFHIFGAIAHFERRLIAERTKDGIAAARAKGKHPGRRPLDADKIAAALSLVKAGLSPTAAAKQLGLGRSTVYREVNRAGIERYPAGATSLETAVGFASGELDA